MKISLQDEEYDLLAGDSLYFAADVPHSYENRGSSETRFLNVIRYDRAGLKALRRLSLEQHYADGVFPWGNTLRQLRSRERVVTI